MTDAVRAGRRTLLLLAVVFLGPMAVAMALYFTGFQWRPEGSTEHGLLFDPARPLPDLPVSGPAGVATGAGLRGKWTLMYIGPGECGPSCRESLVAIRQVRLALGRERDRVQRLYLVTSGVADVALLDAEHEGIGVVADGATVTAVARIAGADPAGDILLADPLGNLVMRYPSGSTMKGIHADLQRLLRLSTIG